MNEIWIVVAVVVIIGIIAVIILFTNTPRHDDDRIIIKSKGQNETTRSWRDKFDLLTKELENNVEKAEIDTQMKMSSSEEKAIEELCNCLSNVSNDCGVNTNSQLWSMLRLRHQTLYQIMNLRRDDPKAREKLSKQREVLSETNKEIVNLVKCYADDFDISLLEKVDTKLLLNNTVKLMNEYKSRRESFTGKPSDSESGSESESVSETSDSY